jgi:uncharacterized lipoprotein YddW (UPF0748 family)
VERPFIARHGVCVKDWWGGLGESPELAVCPTTRRRSGIGLLAGRGGDTVAGLRMNVSRRNWCRMSLGWLASSPGLSAAGRDGPPAVRREFRAMWIATVGNIDWPSKPGLPVAQQQRELRDLLDTARRLNLNAVIFQVRTSCDALYPSPHEPWSEYISGRMGVAPKPHWDPLEFAVREAHQRGLELHAWFNPLRARYHAAISPVSEKHISRTRPDLVLNYGRYLWLDPALAENRELTLKVIGDVLRRYDVDGIHIDDYFYPYPEKVGGSNLPFPDDRSWERYQRGGGTLERADWRRENVNTLVRELQAAVRREKPWVKFGISPFGIWRPGNPPGIRGMDQHEVLYADARRWIREGWADYFAPQLYWTESAEGQRFSKLLGWWIGENVSRRHLWPGINSADIGKNRNLQDVAQLVRLLRARPEATGVIWWNADSLRDDRGGIARLLRSEAFAQPALVPASPWLGAALPPTPTLRGTFGWRRRSLHLQWQVPAGETARWAVLQSLAGGTWRTEILPGTGGTRTFDLRQEGRLPEVVQVTLVSRTGAAGTPATWRREA